VTLWIGLALVWLGIGLRWWAIRELLLAGIHEEDIWVPERQKVYTNRGPYQFLSHPAYVGSLAVLAGAGIACLGWGGAVLALPSWPFFALRIHEENQLRWR